VAFSSSTFTHTMPLLWKTNNLLKKHLHVSLQYSENLHTQKSGDWLSCVRSCRHYRDVFVQFPAILAYTKGHFSNSSKQYVISAARRFPTAAGQSSPSHRQSHRQHLSLETRKSVLLFCPRPVIRRGVPTDRLSLSPHTSH
jgi:hypothetical protein